MRKIPRYKEECNFLSEYGKKYIEAMKLESEKVCEKGKTFFVTMNERRFINTKTGEKFNYIQVTRTKKTKAR